MRARWLVFITAAAAAAALTGTTLTAGAVAEPRSSTPVDILTAPTLVAQTADGDIGYRDVGQGPPIVMIVGSGSTMDLWLPSFVDELAANHRVIVFDNEGVGDTSALSSPVTITKMALQTSALISTLRLQHPAILGWSMGGMVAQALAVLFPSQVSKLILAATQPGNGQSLPIPPSIVSELGSNNLQTAISLLFPADQYNAGLAYFDAVFQYPGFYAPAASVTQDQINASLAWIAGDEPVGYLLGLIHVPTLVADGTEDVVNPVQNDETLVHDIPGAQLVLYPDAGHAFLFQDYTAFVPVVENFLGN